MRATWRISSSAVCLALAIAGASSAHADTPDIICGAAQSQPSAATSNPRTDALRAAAQSIEASTRARGSPRDALAALDVPLDSSESPDAEARAAYCTAAGEVMRLSEQGSQFQAQTYLLRGYRIASGAGIDRIASLAAFRLGLVSSSGSAVAGARSGSRSGRRSSVSLAAELVRTAGETDDDICVDLEAFNLLDNANGYIAEVSLQCSARRALRANDSELAALAYLRLGRLRLGLIDNAGDAAAELKAAALTDVYDALETARQVATPAMRAELIGRLLATALDFGGEPDARFAGYVDAMRAEAGGDLAIEAYANAIEARAIIGAGDLPRAQTLLSQAILLESQRDLPARLPQYYLLLADADPTRRNEHVSTAYTALNNLRPLLPRNDPLTEESTFSIAMRGVFERAVEVELADGELTSGGGNIARAQAIIEAYREAELQSVFGSECIPVRNALRPDELRDNEILLYPILLPDRVELLYVSGAEARDGVASYRRLTPNRTANRESVAKLAESVVLALGYGDDQSWRQPARELYEILIAPIESKLRPDSMLAIIPDGALRAVPFAALQDADGRYLIQKTRLSVSPALAFSQPGDPRRTAAPRIVAASLQRELTLPAGYFPRLEGTADEARIAADSTRGGLFIADFKKADLVEALSAKPVDVLHLATHASFNGRSDRAFVVANGETIPLNELRALIAQNRARGDELALLVLSACETAVGDDEASMGLAGAAVQAGALSAIASLWQVNDAGTAELMKQFYQRYSAGKSRAEALREAQLALLEAGGDNSDANIWSAFILLGAWR